MVTKRNGFWYIYFYPFKDKKIGIKLPDARIKNEARLIEAAILSACRSGDYAGLDAVSREVCVRMFQNQKWEMPSEFNAGIMPSEELTLWRAMELCFNSPDVRHSPNKERMKQCCFHLVEFFGKSLPIKDLWIPQIKEYQNFRVKKGAAPATVNREKSTLSKMFQVLVEMRYLDINPVRLVKPLSEKTSRREVYISFQDFSRILSYLPEWYRPVTQMAFYSGMRRGEILGLTWKRVNLKTRMIYLGPEEVKERNWKRVPIHLELIPILENLRRQRIVGIDQVYLHNSAPIIHKHQVRWCWDRNVAKVENLDPDPRFHDLRHTWKTNARRSGMHPEIEKAIMGHSQRGKSVHEGYGFISDEELVEAIDMMTFDHGETRIWVTERKKPTTVLSRRKNSNSIVTGGAKKVAQK